MMLVNYPNMPTGQTPTMELFQKIVDFGARHNILIVHDNPYSFIRNAAARSRSWRPRAHATSHWR